MERTGIEPVTFGLQSHPDASADVRWRMVMRFLAPADSGLRDRMLRRCCYRSASRSDSIRRASLPRTRVECVCVVVTRECPDQVGDEHGRCIPFGVAGDERMPQRVQGRVVDADLRERRPARPAARSVSTPAGCSLWTTRAPGLRRSAKRARSAVTEGRLEDVARIASEHPPNADRGRAEPLRDLARLRAQADQAGRERRLPLGARAPSMICPANHQDAREPRR